MLLSAYHFPILESPLSEVLLCIYMVHVSLASWSGVGIILTSNLELTVFATLASFPDPITV